MPSQGLRGKEEDAGRLTDTTQEQLPVATSRVAGFVPVWEKRAFPGAGEGGSSTDRRYRRGVQRAVDRLPSAPSFVRVALVVFVLAWLFGPYALQSAVPIWLPFLIALGLELHFFVGALRPGPTRRPDRGPQAVDRERYGYEDDTDELLLVREEGEELWIPYSGETADEVDALVAEERDRFTEEADVSPARGRDGARRQPVIRRFLAGLCVIGGLALVFWIVESRTGWSALDADARAEATARFSREASIVAGKPVTIACDESGEHVGAVQHADGVAEVGGDLAYLTPERCLALQRLAFGGETSSSETARAIAVLAHEAWHLRGVQDEGATECYALQTGVDVGRRLGLTESTARRMMRGQLVENVIRSRASPEYRLPPECRDGGRLDLNPDVARFP